MAEGILALPHAQDVCHIVGKDSNFVFYFPKKGFLIINTG